MFNLPILLAGAALAGSDATTTLRYLRPAGEGWTLESAVTLASTREGLLYESRTVRGQETMTLRVRRDPAGRLIRAEVVQVVGEAKAAAVVTPGKGKLLLRRGAKSEAIDLGEEAIFTTAPDWSDILELVRRYDARKGGKQEFAGCWFHPTRKTLELKFTIEKAGGERLRVGKADLDLTRYRIRLRSGNYAVWALADGRVCKILAEGSKGGGVVLEGFEKAAGVLR